MARIDIRAIFGKARYTSRMPQWIVSFPDRLDSFLSKDGRMLSRAKAQSAIEGGSVSVNEETVTKASFRLQEGDVVEAGEAEAAASADIDPVDLHLPILHEDDACIIIDKPAGIAVHPGAGMGPGEKTLLNGIAFLFKERGLPFSGESVLAHRLDKETTGCLLIAKTAEAHLSLQKQFEDRSVKKEYLAIVAGVPDPPAAVIDASIGRSASDRTKMTVYGSGKSRSALTTYRTLQKSKEAALLACELHTGRTHQIRVHLSSLGHPILGDGTYTNQLSERLSDDHDIRSLCLHAWKLRITSPDTGKTISAEAPLPQEFKASLKKAGLPASF